MDEIPDVLCINCENMIEFTKLEAHSKVCTQPTQQVLKYNSMSFLSGLHFRLTKLKSSVEALVYYGNESLSGSIKGHLEFLIAKANELLSLQDANMDSVDVATAINTQLRNVSAKMPCKYLVYSERLRFLALEKTYFILDAISKKTERTSVSQMLIAKKQEIDYTKKQMKFLTRAKHRIEHRTNSYDNLEEASSNKIPRSSVMSNIGSPAERKEDGFTEIEDFQPLCSGGRQRVVNTKNDMKKSFFSKCLVVKLTFPSKHPAQYIQINELYEKILKNNTPIERWEEFIRDEFDHPERWVNLTVIPRFEPGCGGAS
ncbi:hypothetical protein SteCoe_22843 [Stentor coeruleus]|uniref:Uncharacterized protein n=1 Tax=Stentor coeruleus TaxID=5963 RepID=A0A1R2BLG0_9CILI|nr:hypothetical protein SteCoe_22843 [Stentor coeruleus]